METSAHVPIAVGSVSSAALAALSVSPLDDLGRWLDSCGRDGRAPSAHTRRSYLAGFRAFGAWLTGSDDPAAHSEAVSSLVLADERGSASKLLRAYRAHLLESGLSAGTVNARLTAVRSLWAWARRCGLTSYRPERLSVTAENRHDRRGPTTAEVVALLATCGTDPVGRRDALAIRLGRNLGLRRAEIVGLRIEDIGDGEVRVLGKGRTERVVVTLDPATAASLAAWLEVRGTEPGPLLVRLDAEAPSLAPLTGEAVRRMLDRRARAAGIDRKVRPHGLRHSGATAVARQVGNVSALVAWGRWRTLDTARRYLDDLEEQAANAAREIAV